MKPTAAATIFHVSDVETAVAYYTEVLGFSLDFRYGQLAGLYFEDVQLHLSGPDASVTKRAIGQGHVYIYCDEVDQYYAGITAKGAQPLVTMGNRAYGMRDFAVQDADGNIIAFGTEIAEE